MSATKRELGDLGDTQPQSESYVPSSVQDAIARVKGVFTWIQEQPETTVRVHAWQTVSLLLHDLDRMEELAKEKAFDELFAPRPF